MARRAGLIVMVLSASACGGAGTADPCTGVECITPPADSCRDADVLLDYPARGACDPGSGDCAYTPAEIPCEHGCVAGRCLAEDKCRGVQCDEPPANACRDAGTLLVYEAVGSCDPASGECGYEASELACDHGCENGTCQDQDLCDGVICDDPPADSCADASTLLTYEGAGACDPATGRCGYVAHEQACEHGCEQGRCLTGTEVWGWIAVLETNDTWGWSWNLDVGAYFAEAPTYRTAMPHHVGFFCGEVESADGCTLYSNWNPRLEMCNPPCDPDQECVSEGADWVCRDLPEHFDLGVITVDGLQVPVSMTADEYDRYHAEGLPGDLFDDGDAVTVSTSGGQLDPLSFEAKGVAHLAIDDSRVELVRDQAATIGWTAADPGSRVMAVLMTGPHDPTLPSAALVCDAPDDTGQIKIPTPLVNGFLDRHFVVQKTSRIIRYTRDVQTPYGKEIELLVGSSRGLELYTP